MLKTLQEKRAAAKAALDTLLSTVEGESRDMTTDETTQFDTAVADLKALDERIASLVDIEARDAASAKVASTYTAPAVVTREQQTYEGRNGGPSYFADLFHAKQGDSEARDRLVRAQVETQRETRAGQTTVAGAGGEFAPPLWAVDKFIGLARPARPLADLFVHQDLPAGVSSINIPAIATGATVAAQGAQNTGVSNTDATTTARSSSVNTLAGFAIVSQQELDQSPINMDEVLLADLAADYAQKLDAALVTALAGTAGINSVTYTDAAPSSIKVNQQLGDGIQRIHSNRFAPATVIVMTPRRWQNFLTYTDTAGRPLVTPNPGSQAFNAFGSGGVPDEKTWVAGTLQGLPVVLDPSIPSNLGAGTNQDEVLVLRASDLWLYESAPHADAMPQTLANTMSVLCRFYAYYAPIVRFPKSVSLVSGTGMIPPALGA